MGDTGLHTSMWAPGSEKAFSRHSSQYDWICKSCGFSNFEWRLKCLKCPTAKGAVPWQRDYTTLTASHNGQQENLTLDSSTKQLPPKTGHTKPGLYSYKGRSRGLSTSRWSPRNCSGNQWTKEPQIWTRTVHQPTTSGSSNIASNSPSNPVAFDLGLPYEVQHYILALIQRILEEGCYDFASRWIPQILHGNNWSCSEAVELSIWKKVLPTAIPAAALGSTSASALAASLGHAVGVRNAAVHRHLCDNVELRQMVTQAQSLMHICNDTTREEKFRRLWYALGEWDASKTHDADLKRCTLQQALREIAEREVDNMDWTPNAVSLEQIEDSVECVVNNAHTANEAGWGEDAMMLD